MKFDFLIKLGKLKLMIESFIVIFGLLKVNLNILKGINILDVNDVKDFLEFILV